MLLVQLGRHYVLYKVIITERFSVTSMFMQFNCHILPNCLVFQLKNLVFQSKYLALKNLDFDQNNSYLESEMLKYILGFSHLKFEILDIYVKIFEFQLKIRYQVNNNVPRLFLFFPYVQFVIFKPLS